MAVAALVGCAETAPIVIGLAGPMTDERGIAMRRAAELAVAEINAAGGIDERDLMLVIKDDSASTETAIRVAQEFYGDQRIVAVIGHLTSGATLAAAPIYNGGATPLVELTPTGSSSAITNAGPYTFRTCPTDLVHGTRLAEWARDELRADDAAILYENDDYGRGARNAFASGFVTTGGAVVADDPVVSELPSLEPYLRQISDDGGADVLAIFGSRNTAERVITILDSIGLDLQLLAAAGVAGIERSTVDAFGLLLSSDYFADRPGPRNAAFIDAYRTAHRNELPDHRAAGTYDAVMLVAEALRAAGPNREAVRAHLEQVGNELPPFDGVTGAIAFDQNGDAVGKQVTIGVVATTGLVTVRGQ